MKCKNTDLRSFAYTNKKEMIDLEITLENRPGALAQLGETLGRHHISLAGGGVFYNGERAIAHFLVAEGEKAKRVLDEAGMEGAQLHPVLVQKLRQDVPGQLGEFCRRLASANVNILTQYSDHDHQLILVVDDYEQARKISQQWMQEWW